MALHLGVHSHSFFEQLQICISRKIGLNLKRSLGTSQRPALRDLKKSDHIVGLTGFGWCSPYNFFSLDLDE